YPLLFVLRKLFRKSSSILVLLFESFIVRQKKLVAIKIHQGKYQKEVKKKIEKPNQSKATLPCSFRVS
ncbi:hypothetical protein LINPERPRIM_LOCUS4937, partial [Linum perenne]